MFRRTFLCLLLLGGVDARVAVGQLLTDHWIEVRSQNFTVVSNGSEKQARQVAKEFEQIRAVFKTGFPQLRVESFTPTVVLALKSGDDMRRLVGDKTRGSPLPAGFFNPGWETSYAVVRLDLRSGPVTTRYKQGGSLIRMEVHPETIIHHEYVHELVRLNFARLPVWLDEGLAEFYGNTVVSEKEAKIGTPSPSLGVVRNRPLIPLSELLKAGRRSRYYTQADQRPVFYAQSWALTHFLIFAPEMGKGDKMSVFIGRLQAGKGTDDVEIFRQTFGELRAVEKEFNDYLRQRQFMVFDLKDPPQADENSFHVHSLSPVEATLYVAGFQLALRKPKEALSAVEAVLREKPDIAVAHRLRAFGAFDDGDDDLALQEFSRAAALDPADYLAAYYAAMLRHGNADDPTSLAKLVQELQRVRELNPEFAPVHVELSHTFVRTQRLDLALRAAQYAAGLEPGRAGYHLNVARILLRQGKPDESAEIARFVARRWYGSDRDEALEILRQAQEQLPKSTPSQVSLSTAGVQSDAPRRRDGFRNCR